MFMDVPYPKSTSSTILNILLSSSETTMDAFGLADLKKHSNAHHFQTSTSHDLKTVKNDSHPRSATHKTASPQVFDAVHGVHQTTPGVTKNIP